MNRGICTRLSVGLVVGVVGFLCGCGESSPSSPNGFVVADDTTTCIEGQSCYCAGGLAGTCASGTCRCTTDTSNCPAFAANVAPTFDACGGEPFGTWKATAVDASVPKLWVNGLLDSVPCPFATSEASPLPSFQLRLADGGTGDVYTDGTKLTGDIQMWCAAQVAGNSAACGDLSDSATGFYCKSTDCDRCRCTGRTPASSESIKWTRTAFVVNLGNVRLLCTRRYDAPAKQPGDPIRDATSLHRRDPGSL